MARSRSLPSRSSQNLTGQICCGFSARLAPGFRPAFHGELKTIEENKRASQTDKAKAKDVREQLMRTVQYAPWWVRIVRALCLGAGTMVGYKRIVTTLGERLGKQHLTPAQGASAEMVAASLIGAAGFSGYPVSTTHVVTGGVTGTMVGSGAGVQPATLRQIGAAWLLTLPATIALSGGLFWMLS